MRASTSARRGVTAGLVAATLLLSACGASDGGSATDAVTPDANASEAGSESPGSSTGVAAVDLVGSDVVPSAEIATNELPSVVVNDLNTGREVNFRNLVPQDKPILLWMWAPH